MQQTPRCNGDAQNKQQFVNTSSKEIRRWIREDVLLNTKEITEMLANSKPGLVTAQQTNVNLIKIYNEIQITESSFNIIYRLVKYEGKPTPNNIPIVDEVKTVTDIDPNAQLVKSMEQAEYEENSFAFYFEYTFGAENVDVENFEMKIDNALAFLNQKKSGTNDYTTNVSSKNEDKAFVNKLDATKTQVENPDDKKTNLVTNAYQKYENTPVVRQQMLSIASASNANTPITMVENRKVARDVLIAGSSLPGTALNLTLRGHMALLMLTSDMIKKENGGDVSRLLVRVLVRNISGKVFWNTGYYQILGITNKLSRW